MRRTVMAGSLAPALVLSMMVVASPPAVGQESTIVVNSTDDESDFGGAQQVDDLPGPDGLVTFREAITAANNTAGPNTIAFNIPLDNAELIGDSLRMELEGSPWRLTDDGTTIDGTTQVEFKDVPSSS